MGCQENIFTIKTQYQAFQEKCIIHVKIWKTPIIIFIGYLSYEAIKRNWKQSNGILSNQTELESFRTGSILLKNEIP